MTNITTKVIFRTADGVDIESKHEVQGNRVGIPRVVEGWNKNKAQADTADVPAELEYEYATQYFKDSGEKTKGVPLWKEIVSE
jgi:hypothetical protein